VAKLLFDRFLEDEYNEKAKNKLKSKYTKMAKHFPNFFLFLILMPKERVEAAKKKAEDKVAVVATVVAAEAKKKAEDKAVVIAAAVVVVVATAKFGNIKFPWVTYPLPIGKRIIAG
jgi:hypothetical protein